MICKDFFPHFQGCHLTFLKNFWNTNVFHLCNSLIIYFFFCCFDFSAVFKKSLPNSRSWIFILTPMFYSLNSYIYVCAQFWVHFYVWYEERYSLACKILICPNKICWKDYFPPIEWSWHPCGKSIDLVRFTGLQSGKPCIH